MKKKDVIGIDVSKLTIDAYLKLAQAHAVFSNDTKGFRQLVKWIMKHTDCKTEELLICFETTGLYSLKLASFLSQSNIDFVMENPIHPGKALSALFTLKHGTFSCYWFPFTVYHRQQQW